MESKEFDIIIFGASGYVGRYVIEELSKTVKSPRPKWAVAGRNVETLRSTLIDVQEYVESDITNTTIIQADVQDSSSIIDMCKRTRLILNCVGPYALYGGETVVSSCIETGTHCVDLSAEIKFLDEIQLKYFNLAREKGVYIVGACGFGSVPADYGVSLLKQKFQGGLNSVEYYFERGVGSEKTPIHVGTLWSVLDSVPDFINAKKYEKLLKDQIYTKEGTKSNYPISRPILPLFYSSKVNGWCCAYIGPDKRNIRRSQIFRSSFLNDEKLVSTLGYFKTPSLFVSFWYIIGFALAFLMSRFSLGDFFLRKYPSFFTAGLFSESGPTRKQILEGSTKITLYSEGWRNKLQEPTDQHATKPDKKIKLTITGPEPAYPFTAICMVQSGLVILEEEEKLPLTGGVLTPGVAFQNTSLLQRLEKSGISFTFENDE